jgi:hypothetical protein
MLHPDVAARTSALAAGALALFAVATTGAAHAQAKLEASYAVTAARLAVGNATVTVEIADGAYTMTMRGRASGMMRFLASGDGNFSTHGQIKDGRLLPENYNSTSTSDDEKLDVKMLFADGSVKELTASPPPPSKDRVPLTDVHRKDIVDPLTALLIPASEDNGGVARSACERTLPIFDGRRRYDLKLAFKRNERVKADKGYAGPVVVCAVTFQPIAGHRTSSPMVKYLGDGRALEFAFAPVAGTKLLAPFWLSVANMLGNIVVQASRYEVGAPPSGPASTTGSTPD